MPVDEEKQPEYELRGKAWKVYWLLLKEGSPMSARDVQRTLRFTSPSIAQHHLDRLCELGVVSRKNVGGAYKLASEVKVGVLRHFMKFGRHLFPRFFFYAVFSTTLYISYVAVFLRSISVDSVFILCFGAFILFVLWYEARRIWMLKPV